MFIDDKIAGCLIGGAAGDALGYAVEFDNEKAIEKKYGKNAIVRGMNLEEGATAIERNKQIGGHKA